MPNIGASGAIAAVLGGYLVLYPRAAVITFIPPIFFFPLPAVLFLLGWILLQVYSAGSVQVGSAGGGIAYFAHIGGFVFGLLTIRWWVRQTSADAAARQRGRRTGNLLRMLDLRYDPESRSGFVRLREGQHRPHAAALAPARWPSTAAAASCSRSRSSDIDPTAAEFLRTADEESLLAVIRAQTGTARMDDSARRSTSRPRKK